jgi:SAM-dependent methyltransferase
MSKPYTIMAKYYDYMLRHVDYNEWYDYLKKIMQQYVKAPKKILEIGTGTGKFGAKFSSDKYNIYGMDNSFEMLRIAAKRAHKNFRIFCADVRNFYLKGNFDFIFSVHDTLNYLIKKNELKSAFTNIHKIMHDNSIFMFDITTEYNIQRYFDNQQESYRVDSHQIVWDNYYNYQQRVITSKIDFFNEKGKCHTEIHKQKIHLVPEIEKLLEESGFEIIDIFSDYTFMPYNNKTVMINFITRKRNS